MSLLCLLIQCRNWTWLPFKAFSKCLNHFPQFLKIIPIIIPPIMGFKIYENKHPTSKLNPSKKNFVKILKLLKLISKWDPLLVTPMIPLLCATPSWLLWSPATPHGLPLDCPLNPLLFFPLVNPYEFLYWSLTLSFADIFLLF